MTLIEQQINIHTPTDNHYLPHSAYMKSVSYFFLPFKEEKANWQGVKGDRGVIIKMYTFIQIHV